MTHPVLDLIKPLEGPRAPMSVFTNYLSNFRVFPVSWAGVPNFWPGSWLKFRVNSYFLILDPDLDIFWSLIAQKPSKLEIPVNKAFGMEISFCNFLNLKKWQTSGRLVWIELAKIGYICNIAGFPSFFSKKKTFLAFDIPN